MKYYLTQAGREFIQESNVVKKGIEWVKKVAKTTQGRGLKGLYDYHLGPTARRGAWGDQRGTGTSPGPIGARRRKGDKK
jgi:hypothetical protein